jgi:DNA polymerase I-like protein with 3'-5' exonuclease and polymerase domains
MDQMNLGLEVSQYTMPLPTSRLPIRVVGHWHKEERDYFSKVFNVSNIVNNESMRGYLNIVHSGDMPLPAGRMCGKDDMWYFCVPARGDGRNIMIREGFEWAVQAASNVSVNYELNWVSDDEMDLLLKQKGDTFALDLETTSLDPVTGKIVTCGLCSLLDESVCVVTGTQATQLLRYMVAKKVRVVLCNSKFEQKWSLIHGGGLLNCVSDVQVNAALLNEEGHKGLDYLSMQIGMAGYDIEMTNFIEPLNETTGKSIGKRTHAEAPIKLLSGYNALDCLVTGRVYKKQLKALNTEPGGFPFKADLLMRQCQVALAMVELTGMKLDASEVLGHYGKMVSGVKLIEMEFTKLAREKEMTKFTPGYSKDMVKLLNLCGVGVTSCNKAELEDFEDYSPMVKKISQYQRDKSLISGLMQYCTKAVSNDCVLRTNMDCTSLVTGQLTSFDPPMLNIAKGKIRSMFTSRFGKDGVILELDYSQLHLRIMGNISGCKNFIDAYSKGADLHARTGAHAVLEISEEEMLERLAKKDQKAIDARQLGKRTNFGIITEISYHGLSKLVRISVSKAERILSLFYAANPEIKAIQRHQHDLVRSNGYVVSPTGRIRHLPDAAIRDLDEYERERVSRQATDYLISNPGRTTTIIAMVAMQRKMREMNCKSVLINQIHDSLVHDIHLSEMDDFLGWARECYIKEPTRQLSSIYNPIGLEMDGKYGTHWDGCKLEKFTL